MPEQERITEEQAFEALQQLTGHPEESEEPEVSVPEPAPEPEPPAAAAAATAETETETPQEQEAQPAETDDVASLRKRLEEKEAREQENEERVKAIQDRYAINDRIRQDRFLKKSTAADRARQILTKVRSEQGLTTEDVERALQELGGTMNPASTSYEPPPPAPQYTERGEEAAIILNDFLNEKGMTSAQQNAFGAWVQTEGQAKLSPSEQAVGERDLDGFLRLAHARWQQSVAENGNAKRQDAVDAVKTVQRTQREAAKAAATAPTAPRKQPATPKAGTVDTKTLTKDDISQLLRMSVEQYK